MMDSSHSRIGPLISGAGGALLIASLFLPWADLDGVGRSGWELWTMADLLFLIAGLAGIAAALTGGRVGVFRADMSLNGLTDMLGVISTLLICWLILFDFPAGASREAGVFLALLGAIAVMCGVGVYRMPPGGWFPRMT